MTKMTKKDWFGIIDVALDHSNMDEVTLMGAHNFIDHEVQLLSRKTATRGETATQKANAALMDRIVDCLKMIDRPVTISEFQKEFTDMAEYSNQKLSSLFSKLVTDNRIVKTVDKKRSYFSAVEA